MLKRILAAVSCTSVSGAGERSGGGDSGDNTWVGDTGGCEAEIVAVAVM